MNEDPIMQFFTFEHLEEAFGHLEEPAQSMARGYAELAKELVATLPENEERKVTLDKLLESRDAAIRAAAS